MDNLVLVVADEAPVRDSLRIVLEESGFRVVTAKDGRDGLASFTERKPQVVIADVVMPEQEGIETIIKMRRARADVRIVAMGPPAEAGKPDLLKIATEFGADATLKTPVDPSMLVDTVRQLTARRYVLTWSDELKIDGGIIDEDHQRLIDIMNIDIINTFFAATPLGHDLTAASATLASLAAYAASHFEREEALQKLIGYPGADDQRMQHQAMVARLQALQSRLAGGDGVNYDPTIEVDLTDFLSQWLARHIMHSDLLMRPYAEALRTAGRGMPPLSGSSGDDTGSRTRNS